MANFSITVNGVNSKVIANDDLINILPNTSKIIDVLVNDIIIGTPVSITIEIPPVNGTVVIVNNKLNYTPNNNIKGTDSFVYKITNGIGEFDMATVNIIINTAIK